MLTRHCLLHTLPPHLKAFNEDYQDYKLISLENAFQIQPIQRRGPAQTSTLRYTGRQGYQEESKLSQLRTQACVHFL